MPSVSAEPTDELLPAYLGLASRINFSIIRARLRSNSGILSSSFSPFFLGSKDEPSVMAAICKAAALICWYSFILVSFALIIGVFCEAVYEGSCYFLAFLLLLTGFSGLVAFLGRPLPGTLRIASKTSTEYTASLVSGLYPPRSMRLITVSRGNLSFSDISEMVIPFMPYIIGIFTYFLKIVRYIEHLLYKRKVKFEKIFQKCAFSRTFMLI